LSYRLVSSTAADLTMQIYAKEFYLNIPVDPIANQILVYAAALWLLAQLYKNIAAGGGR
jgi:hypothetical protein